mgnify:CR=1 FL=1
MRNNLKRISALFLALVMALSLSVTAFATTPTTAGDMNVTCGGKEFSNTPINYTNSATGENVNAYGHLLIDSSASGSMTLTMEFNGTGLKINGESVTTTGSTYTDTFNLASQVLEVEVLYGTNQSSMHYISAHTSGAMSATVNIDYSRATYFGTLTGPTTYTYPGKQHCPYLDTVTQDQIDYMNECLGIMNTYFATEASKTATYSSLANDCTAAGILEQICHDRDELTVTYDGSMITHVGFLGTDSATTWTYYGTSYNSGGWMYKVLRGDTEMLPMVGATAFPLMPGDVVTWFYSVDLGYDYGNAMM